MTLFLQKKKKNGIFAKLHCRISKLPGNIPQVWGNGNLCRSKYAQQHVTKSHSLIVNFLPLVVVKDLYGIITGPHSQHPHTDPSSFFSRSTLWMLIHGFNKICSQNKATVIVILKKISFECLLTHPAVQLPVTSSNTKCRRNSSTGGSTWHARMTMSLISHNSVTTKNLWFFRRNVQRFWGAIIFCECNKNTTALQRLVLLTTLWH
jgi:hypothetical protein